MKLISLSVLFFFISFSYLRAQTIEAPWLMAKKAEMPSKTIFDKGTQRLFYKVTYRPDHEVKERTKEALTVLIVGEKALMYEDYNELRCDSIGYAYEAEGKTNGDYFSVALPLRTQYKDIIITLLEGGNLIYTLKSVPFQEYYYEEPIPTYDWQLTGETKTLLGLQCHKATTSFRGRDYEAWYSEELPLPYGPYKFGGLPGLIVEIYDTERDYHFELVQMQQGEMGDQIGMDFESNSLFKVSREGAMKALENYRRDPGKMISQRAKSADGGSIRAKSLPHNPIERE